MIRPSYMRIYAGKRRIVCVPEGGYENFQYTIDEIISFGDWVRGWLRDNPVEQVQIYPVGQDWWPEDATCQEATAVFLGLRSLRSSWAGEVTLENRKTLFPVPCDD